MKTEWNGLYNGDVKIPVGIYFYSIQVEKICADREDDSASEINIVFNPEFFSRRISREC